MFRAGDIRRNVLLKLIRLCMETPCLCPSEGHKYGGRKECLENEDPKTPKTLIKTLRPRKLGNE